jgi:hypothetical protein
MDVTCTVMTRRRLLRIAASLMPVSTVASAQNLVAALEHATIGAITEIDDEHDRPFNLQGEGSSVVRVADRPGRRGTRWFSYDVPTDRSNAVAVVVTYNTLNDRPRTFDVLVDGERVAEEYLPARRIIEFFDVHYGIPAGLATAKSRLTVRFVATEGNEIAPVFAIRTVRA